MSMNIRIKSAMRTAGYDQTSLAANLNVTPQAVQQWISGKTCPKGARLEKLIKVLRCNGQWLITGVGIPYANSTPSTLKISEPETRLINNIDPIKTGEKVPLISEIQAGAWCEAIEKYSYDDVEDWLYCPVKHGKNTYALRVVGDSMTNPYQGKSYPEGTIIFIDPDRQLTSGCRVIAKQSYYDMVTFKEYREDNGKKYLKPLNPQYDMIEINDETRICGVVIFSGMAE